MKRTPLAERVLPNYTINEEKANSISHWAGVACSIPVLCIFPLIASAHNNLMGLVSSAIFGSSLFLLYAMSAIYHGLPQNTYIKKVFQVIDHCTIFVLIAGSYTGFVLTIMYEADPFTAIWILAVIWIAAIVGIVLNAIDLKRYQVFSMCCYLMMGWLIIFKSKLMMSLMSKEAFGLLLAGGILIL